jgi:hypothetical protein
VVVSFVLGFNTYNLHDVYGFIQGLDREILFDKIIKDMRNQKNNVNNKGSG